MYSYEAILDRIPRLDDEEPDCDLSIKAQAKRLACSEGTVRRAITEGLNPYQFDRICVKGLGLHPAGVIGFKEWVFGEDIALDEDGSIDGTDGVEAERFGRRVRKIA